MSPHRTTTFNPTCDVPLCCMEECVFRKCPETENRKYRNYELDDTKHLSQIDPYWAELLEAQQKSTANYLYSLNIYGNAKDPTVKTRIPFSPDLIHQRLQHMPVVGGLKKNHMFLMLSIILNLSQVKTHKQKEYMESLQTRGLLTREILQYLKIIGHHPNTGLAEPAGTKFQDLCNELLQNSSQDPMCDLNYFNPDHIFSKSLNALMDPYELEYLRNIFECKENLSSSQFMYLVNFVERLQEMKLKKRNQYLKILRDKGIIPSSKFCNLLRFLKSHNYVLDGKTLRTCFYALEDLMELGPCAPRPDEGDSADDDGQEIDIDKFMKAMIAAAEAKKSAEEASRKAAEEAAKKEAAEAAKKAAEEAARKAAEEAAKIAAEEAAKKAAKEAAKKAAEEAARKAAEEAARKAAEEAARKQAEEAARKAAEEAAKKAAIEAARKAEEEAARKAAKEAARKAANEKKLAEKAALKEKEDAAKLTKAISDATKKEDKPKKLEKAALKETKKEDKPKKFEKADGGKKDKKDKGNKKDKQAKDKNSKDVQPPEEIPVEVPVEEPAENQEEACVRNIRFTSYPLCQPRRCPPTRPANGCPDPDTSFTCLCPAHRPRRQATPSREQRMYACDGTVLIFPRFC